MSAADALNVHVRPSGLVITRLPVPEEATATNKPFAYVTENQLLSAADARDVHVMPSGLVITRSPVPKKAATATNKPFPYVTERQLLFVADVLNVHDSPPPGVPGTPDWAAGVTDADGVDAAEVPPALLAVAVNVYAVPFVRPDTTHAPDAPTIVHVAPPGDAVTVCDVAGHTSMASATDTLTAPSPTTAPGAVGTLGFAIGVTDADGVDAAEVPPALLAVAVNVYAVPFVRPDTTHAPDAPTIVHVAPPGDAVTVCDVAGHTSMASATDTLTAPSPTTAPGAVGTLGFAIGVTDADGVDAAEVPPAFVAVAVNV